MFLTISKKSDVLSISLTAVDKAEYDALRATELMSSLKTRVLGGANGGAKSAGYLTVIGHIAEPLVEGRHFTVEFDRKISESGQRKAAKKILAAAEASALAWAAENGVEVR